MTSAVRDTVIDNAGWPGAQARLSVLIPFFRDDPCDLLRRLDAESESLDGAVEIVLLDDAGGDAALSQRAAAAASTARLPVRLVRLSANAGRAKGRNRLAAEARGRTLLFLDSDMRPDSPDFLARWLAEADAAPAVVFGGFSLKSASIEPRFAVHRAVAGKSECADAATRSRQPAKFVYTSNLLVPRAAFEAEAFDDGFTGWGWEDVEWALRIARRFPVRHIDNPATHLGLDTAEALAGKYEQSVPNFARLAQRHPEAAAEFPIHRAARLLARAPALPLWRPLLRQAAIAPVLPVRMRAFALRLYRAALYAPVAR